MESKLKSDKWTSFCILFNYFLTADTILTSINIDLSTGEHYATEVIIWGKGEPGTSLGILKYVLFEIFPCACWKCLETIPLHVDRHSA